MPKSCFKMVLDLNLTSSIPTKLIYRKIIRENSRINKIWAKQSWRGGFEDAHRPQEQRWVFSRAPRWVKRVDSFNLY